MGAAILFALGGWFLFGPIGAVIFLLIALVATAAATAPK